MSASDACCVTVFKASPPDPVDNVDIYTNACINYAGTLLCFPSFYFQFPTDAVWKAGNDGLLDLRLLHGGRWSDGELALRSLNYTAAWNARSPYVPLGINRCAFEGSVFQTGGWCSATDGSLASTSVATSRLYMGHGYLVSANGEEVYQYAAANPVSEAAYDIKGSQNATYHSWGNNSAVVRLVSRRDGECSSPFRLCPKPEDATAQASSVSTVTRCSPPRTRPALTLPPTAFLRSLRPPCACQCSVPGVATSSCASTPSPLSLDSWPWSCVRPTATCQDTGSHHPTRSKGTS